MRDLELRYVAHITTLTRTVKEKYRTNADTLRDLINELDEIYLGIKQTFINAQSGALNLNAMIYYSIEGEPPFAVVDLDQPIQENAVVTFW
jgi:molybdopterin converting factor small subunit